jgi:hypothetical protein
MNALVDIPAREPTLVYIIANLLNLYPALYQKFGLTLMKNVEE